MALVRALQREDRAAVLAVRRAEKPIAQLAERLTRILLNGGRLFYVGAGTSGRLGVLDAAELPPTFGISPARARGVIAGGGAALSRAIEGAEDDEASARAAMRRHRIGARDLVVGISASGTTPFVLTALAEARRRGAIRALVCCQRPPRGLGVEHLVWLDTGPELIAGSTRLKAGTATKLTLNALSTVALVRAGHVYRGEMVDLRVTNQKLRARAIRLVSTLGKVSLARARSLLQTASGKPRVALALLYTGRPLPEAKRLLRQRGLAALEPSDSDAL